jgi:hypothetical protein
VGLGDYYTHLNNYSQAHTQYERAKNCLAREVEEKGGRTEVKRIQEENEDDCGRKNIGGEEDTGLYPRKTLKRHKAFTESFSLEKEPLRSMEGECDNHNQK